MSYTMTVEESHRVNPKETDPIVRYLFSKKAFGGHIAWSVFQHAKLKENTTAISGK